MTTADNNRTADSIDRMADMHRQQLSALIDGELPADQSRFLIRRLEHDEELAGCQERWQLVGDALRGQLGAVAPVDFAGRVQAAVAAAPSSGAKPGSRLPLARYAVRGGALAAVLALFALVPLLRHTSEGTLPDAGLPAVAAAPESSGITPVSPSGDGQVSEALSAVGLPMPSPPVNDRPVPVAAAKAVPSRSTSSRPAVRPAPAEVPAPMLASQLDAGDASVSPFALPEARPAARAWPRSGLSGDGRFHVRLSGAGQSDSNPFAPDVAAEQLRATSPQP